MNTNPRPLHRWKSFWFGVLMLVFLGWSWVGSMRQGTAIVPVRKSSVVFYQEEGRLRISLYPRSSAFPQGIHHFPVGDIINGKILFAPMVKVTRYPTEWYVHVAHWFLILLFALSWSGFLQMRRRRMKRMAGG